MPRSRIDSPATGRLAIAVAYATYYGALGVYIPFLAVYLRHRGLGIEATAYLLALLPVARAVATPAWTLLADALGSPRTVLRIVVVGTLSALAGLGVARGAAGLAAVFIALSAFRGPTSSLMDVVALDHTGRWGGQFGALRSWGTIGYTATTFATGLALGHWGAGALVPAALALQALTVVVTFAIRAAPHPALGGNAERRPLLPSLRLLIGQPRFLLFLSTAALHQVGVAAYDNLFAEHVTRLESSAFAGFAVAFGAAAESVVMARAGSLLRAASMERVLLLSYAASAVRWVVVALVRDPIALLAVQVLHGLTWGGFYVAAVQLVHAASPPAVRATAQGIFAVVVLGFGTSAALLLCGWLGRLGGMPAIFGGAAAASALACALGLGLVSRGPTRPPR